MSVLDVPVASMDPIMSAGAPDTVVEMFLNQFNDPQTSIDGEELKSTLEDIPEEQVETPDQPEPVGGLDGFYTQPAVYGDLIVFVSEDDLWSVPIAGGTPTKLTNGIGEVWRPRISPNGEYIAYSASSEGSPDVYVMPLKGGESRRLTYTGMGIVVNWTPDSKRIVFCSRLGLIHDGQREELFLVPIEGGQPEPIGVGWANYLIFGAPHCESCVKPGNPCSRGQDCVDECRDDIRGCYYRPEEGDDTTAPVAMTYPSVLGRFTADISNWKRYQGGRRGKIFIDSNGDRSFEEVVSLKYNIGMFVWVHGLIVFVSDKECEHGQLECVGNLYAVDPGASVAETQADRIAERTASIQQVTSFTDHYVRNPVASPDMSRIVFTKGADIFYMDVSLDGSFGDPQLVPIHYVSPREQRRRQFLSADVLSQYSLSPNAQNFAFISRGRPFVQNLLRDGAPIQYGQRQGVRYTNTEFLSTGDLLAVSDEMGEVGLEVFKIQEVGKVLVSEHVVGGRVGSTLGRIESIAASPKDPLVAIVSHTSTLTVFDLTSSRIVCSINSPTGGIDDVSWSPDGYWIAFSYTVAERVSIIRIMKVKEGGKLNSDFDVCGVVDITDPILRDFAPSWDPEGRYLYFLSIRDFSVRQDGINPIGLAFVGNARPFLVTLSAGDQTPFHVQGLNNVNIRSIIHKIQAGVDVKDEMLIDLTNIKNRIIAFPVEIGDYHRVIGLPGQRVWFIKRALDPDLGPAFTTLQFDFLSNSLALIDDGMVGADVSQDKSTVIVVYPNKVCTFPSSYRDRVLPGLLRCPDVRSLTYQIDPIAEWRQIFSETWRRARDNFWTPTMNDIDWRAVRTKYEGLLERIHTRSELTDIINQLHGELGTSHAFHRMMRHRTGKRMPIGRLGCDVTWDTQNSGYRITKVLRGDSWDLSLSGPLARPGLNVQAGDVILKINGEAMSRNRPLDQELLGRAGVPVQVTLLKTRTGQVVEFTTTTLSSDVPVRFRDWVASNQAFVERATNGQVGYIHIPDMVAEGWAEFHRAFISQAGREALIVDLRYNSGGRISPEILDKLSRRTTGYMRSRWGEAEPYPHNSAPGPTVALINSGCASDCDIISTTICERMNYKVPSCGDGAPQTGGCKLIGEQTWGGVVGISWRGQMVDGSETSQPEYAHWFIDGRSWDIENGGVHPDLLVPYSPNDFVNQRADPQLQAGVDDILRVLQSPAYLAERRQCLPDLNPAFLMQSAHKGP
eukprot:c12748_g1_i1.p1 GENE.c12748_g1_i1~~c12748_g1_i1.p1  ORF type:complete len:1408 (+),score=318.64 c12748_g1_i1:519-4226(+)